MIIQVGKEKIPVHIDNDIGSVIYRDSGIIYLEIYVKKSLVFKKTYKTFPAAKTQETLWYRKHNYFYL